MKVYKSTLLILMLIILTTFLFTSNKYSLLQQDAQVKLKQTALLKSNYSLVLWSNDYHISPIKDLKHLLSSSNVRFIDKSLSGHCHVTNTCQGRSTLRVINVGNAMDAGPTLMKEFYTAYKDDAEIKSVDAFVCFHPTSMCELFEPFNRSLIIIASTRYELGRFGADRWTTWNRNLVRYAADPRNVVAGNNLYDVEYIKYFTGIQPVLLPSFCDYIGLTYNPTRPGFLVADIHHSGLKTVFFQKYEAACKELNCTTKIDLIRSKYPNYKYSDLTAHSGIIYVPYQVSVMSFFEQYRMNIPMFCPSLELLTDWQHSHMVMTERTWSGVHGGRPNNSSIPPHPSQRHLPDPNNEQSREAINYWIKFADYYQMPHVIYYDSAKDLVNKLQNTTHDELLNISKLMKVYNLSAKKQLMSKWENILANIAKYSPNNLTMG